MSLPASLITSLRIAARYWHSMLCGLLLLLGNELVVAAPTVAVSIKPLQHVVAAITAGISEPQLIIDASQDPHNLSLRPSERRALDEAALVVWIGPALELPLVKLVQQAKGKALTVQYLAGLELISLDDELDPHLWLDTRNAALIAAAVANELSTIDATNSAQYHSNLRTFEALLKNTEATLRTTLDSIHFEAWAVDHHSLRYLQQQFALPAALQLKDSNNNAPGLRSALAFHREMKAHQLSCIVAEPGVNAAELRALLDDKTLRVQTADILGLSVAVAAASYATLMLGVAEAVISCAGGSHE